jgi:hypothetical protein
MAVRRYQIGFSHFWKFTEEFLRLPEGSKYSQWNAGVTD